MNRSECLEALKSIEEKTTEVEDYLSIPVSTCCHAEDEICILKQLVDKYFNLCEKYRKLEAENIGLKQSVKNYKEKQEKFFRSIHYCE